MRSIIHKARLWHGGRFGRVAVWIQMDSRANRFAARGHPDRIVVRHLNLVYTLMRLRHRVKYEFSIFGSNLTIVLWASSASHTLSSLSVQAS